jgi:hypothetical protein
MNKMLVDISESSTTLPGLLAHGVGLVGCIVLLGFLAPREAPGSEPRTHAVEYMAMSPANCAATFDRVLQQAKVTGRHAWVWTDESGPGTGLADARMGEATGMAGSVPLSSLDADIFDRRFARPLAARPVPAAVATDVTATRPEGTCRFVLNALHVHPKAS